jgi:hypothetical protein
MRTADGFGIASPAYVKEPPIIFAALHNPLIGSIAPALAVCAF